MSLSLSRLKLYTYAVCKPGFPQPFELAVAIWLNEHKKNFQPNENSCQTSILQIPLFYEILFETKN